MTLPKSIQRQLDAAQAIEAQLAQAAPTAPDGVVVPAVSSLETGTVVSAEQLVVAAPAPAEPEPVAPPPPAAPTPDWEHKYKTIQGMYNSHVPKLQAQLKEAQAQMEQMRSQLEKPAEPQKPAVDPKDVETFGADLVEMVSRTTERLFGPLAARFEQRLVDLESKVGGATRVAAQTAEQTFLATVGKLVPDWEVINTDQRFLDWLDEPDPIYGKRRQEALNEAQQTFDAHRAANVFRAWKQLQAPVAPVAPPVSQRPSLEAQVAPRAAATVQPVPAVEPSKQVITQMQIQRFYDDVTKGRYRGREQEAAAFEAQIHTAIAEGRVR